jgi:hypothetical protein
MTALDTLIIEFQAWCKGNNLPQMSADELFCEKVDVLTAEQKSYLLEFIERWEEAEDHEVFFAD